MNKNKSLSSRKRGDDLILKQIFGKAKTQPKGFFGKGLHKTLNFIKQLKPVHSIGIVIAAVFVLQLIIPQSVLWPWNWAGASNQFSGFWLQEDWSGGKGQGNTTEEEGNNQYATDDGRISVAENFSGKAGFAAYPERADVSQGNDSQNSTVAVDASERAVTVWTDKSVNGKQRLFARLAGKDGRALPLGNGTDVRLDGISDDNQAATFDQAIVVYEPVTNQFLVTWSRKFLPQIGKMNVYLRVLKIDSGNNLVKNDTIHSVAGNDNLTQSNPHIAVRYHFSSQASGKSQNDIIVTWQEEILRGGFTDYDVKAVAYRIKTSKLNNLEVSDDGALRIDQKIATPAAVHSTKPQVAIATNGSLMITWTDDRGGDKDIYGRKFTVSEFWPVTPK